MGRVLLIYDPGARLASATEFSWAFESRFAQSLSDFRNILIDIQPAFILAYFDFSDEASKDFLAKLRFHRRFKEVPLIQVSYKEEIDEVLQSLRLKLEEKKRKESNESLELLLNKLQLNPIEEELMQLLIEKKGDSLSMKEVREKLSGTKILIMDHALKKQVEVLEGKLKKLLGTERFSEFACFEAF